MKPTKTTKIAFSHIIDAYRDARAQGAGTPAETIAAAVHAYPGSPEDLRTAVAAAVNICSWDGRIWPQQARWAAAVTDEGTEDASYIPRIDEIHRAHLDQLAQEARTMDWTPLVQAWEDAQEAPQAQEDARAGKNGQEAAQGVQEAPEAAADPAADALGLLDAITAPQDGAGYYNARTLAKFREALDEARKAIADGKKGADRVSVSAGNRKTGLGVGSVSLLPYLTCPACCRWTCGPACYAAKLAALRPSVLRAWARNTAIYLGSPSDFWRQVREAVPAFRWFRFHVGGDFPDPAYLRDAVVTAWENPGTEFLAFTKRHGMVNAYVDGNGGPAAAIPSNFKILFSGWEGLDPVNPHGFPETAVYAKGEAPDPSWLLCGGNCIACACRGLGCWRSRAGDTIAFEKH